MGHKPQTSSHGTYTENDQIYLSKFGKVEYALRRRNKWFTDLHPTLAVTPGMSIGWYQLIEAVTQEVSARRNVSRRQLYAMEQSKNRLIFFSEGDRIGHGCERVMREIRRKQDVAESGLGIRFAGYSRADAQDRAASPAKGFLGY